MSIITLNVNGEEHTLDVDTSTPLLYVLRNALGFEGPRFGCGLGQCGACTVIVDGEAVRSCITPTSVMGGDREITTLEGLAVNGELHPVQQAWIKHQVPQCGYCQSGQIMAAVSLLNKKPQPTDADINAAMTNICRCGTYKRIRDAIHDVAGNNAENTLAYEA